MMDWCAGQHYEWAERSQPVGVAPGAVKTLIERREARRTLAFYYYIAVT
jgi:hypothetical protein